MAPKPGAKKAGALAQLAARLNTRKRPLPPELQQSAAEARAALKTGSELVATTGEVRATAAGSARPSGRRTGKMPAPAVRAAAASPAKRRLSSAPPLPPEEVMTGVLESFVAGLAEAQGLEASPEYIAHTAGVLAAWERHRAAAGDTVWASSNE